MEFLNLFLPVLLYIVAIILLIILIIVSLRFLRIMDKVDDILDDIHNKVDSFDGAITVFRRAANGFASISDSMVLNITSIISKIFKRKKEED